SKADTPTDGKNRTFTNCYSTMQLIISNFRQAFPCLFPVCWCFLPGSSPGGTVPQAFIFRFKAFRPSNGHEYGAGRKNAIQWQNTSASGTKNHCTLTIIYIG